MVGIYGTRPFEYRLSVGKMRRPKAIRDAMNDDAIGDLFVFVLYLGPDSRLVCSLGSLAAGKV